MTDKGKLDKFMEKNSLFSSLKEESFRMIKERMKLVKYKPGETVCEEGDEGDALYIIDSGEISVLKKGKDNREVEITSLKQGEITGMMSLFGKEVRSATLRASGNVSLWRLEKEGFQELIENNPPLCKQLLQSLSKHLRRETKLVAELRSYDTENRLKVAVFDSKPYTMKTFDAGNNGKYALTYFDARLNAYTAALASGFKVICAFVNDDLSAGVIDKLGESGVEMIAMRCAGYNNVDLKACEKHGISVARVPAYSPYAVAEHAVALMMALNRKTQRAHLRIREGNFSLNGLVGFDMHGRTAGVVGTGKIGKCVIDILAGFGCSVIAYDKFRDKKLEESGRARYVELDELFAGADIITLHAPLLPETKYMINADSIAKMKDGVMLINTSRGGLIDTRSLIDGLKTGKVGYAGLDVYEEESKYFFEDFSETIIEDEILARLTTFNNVMVTSHMAFLTREALGNIAKTTFGNIGEYESGKRGKELTYAV